MIARLDHRPMLTALLALTTTVLVVVVITLATLLYTSAQAATSSSVSDGGNAGVAAPANMDAGGESYGRPIEAPTQTGNGADSAIDRHAVVVASHKRLPNR